MKDDEKERTLVSLLNQYENDKAQAKEQIDDLWKIRFNPNFLTERAELYKNDETKEYGTTEDYYHNEYLGRIDSFFNFVNERINHASSLIGSQPEASSYSEAFGVIETLSFNRYYRGNEKLVPGKFFKLLLREHAGILPPNDEIIWTIYRNIAVHIRDLPSSFPFDEIYTSNDIINICHKASSHIGDQCREAQTDPAPKVFRRHLLYKFKCKYILDMLCEGRKKGFNKLANTYWERLNNIKRIQY